VDCSKGLLWVKTLIWAPDSQRGLNAGKRTWRPVSLEPSAFKRISAWRLLRIRCQEETLEREADAQKMASKLWTSLHQNADLTCWSSPDCGFRPSLKQALNVMSKERLGLTDEFPILPIAENLTEHCYWEKNKEHWSIEKLGRRFFAGELGKPK